MSATQSVAPVRNSKFYIDDRKPFVTFQVEGQLFRVHRYLFELESEVFKSMFEIPQGDNIVEGETDESPIILPSVSVAEIEALLNFFYFRQGVEEAKFSEADWCNLLSISHRYECGRARERSIREINKLDPPVNDADKIAMAKKFGVEEWLLPACVALVERREPLSYAEAEKLGLGMTVLLSAVREKWLQRQQNPSYNAFNSYGQQPNKDSTRFVKVVLWESQEKLDAAGRIEATYIRHLTRKKAFSMSTDVNAIRVRFWIQLQTRTAEMDWGRLSVYKLMLLGPVVHILVCLEVLGAATESAKRDARKRFNVAHHQELEDLMKSMERYSGLLKAIIDLRKKLAPSSNFHERQDLRALKAAVLEVQMVIEQAAKDSFFVSDMKRIGQDWDLGRKGILEEAIHRKV